MTKAVKQKIILGRFENGFKIFKVQKEPTKVIKYKNGIKINLISGLKLVVLVFLIWVIVKNKKIEVQINCVQKLVIKKMAKLYLSNLKFCPNNHQECDQLG